jgi:hypothetical protein
MPISANPGIFDEQSSFSDYMAVIGGLGLAEQIYSSKRLKLNLAKVIRATDKYSSPAYWGMWAADTSIGSLLAAVTRGTDRL